MLVTPLPGVNREDLLKTMREVHASAVNMRNGHGPVVDRYNDYLRWVADATGQLRGRISAPDIERLVLTRRYWHLQALMGGVVSNAMSLLIATEMDERVDDLHQACRALEQQIERWSRLGVFAVADTSFYIQHPDTVDKLDLRSHLNVRDAPVHLIVPIVVVDQMDSLKQAGKGSTRGRARYTLAVIDRVLDDPTQVARLRTEDFTPLSSGGIPRGEMTVELLFDPPGHARLPIADDEIIDRALAVQGLADRPVTMITYDTGQSTRARAAGLTVVKLREPINEPGARQAK
jgi:hypothetical protein